MLYPGIKKDIDKALEFHKKNALGLIIGVYMVDYALELLDGIYPDRNSYTLNALCETRVCLIDSIQIMTGCTVGNKYLKLNAMKNGRYALILYNRDTSLGYRVYIDLSKIDKEKYPQLYAFFAKTRDYKNAVRKELSKATIEEFYTVERGIFSYQKVKVNVPAKDPLEPAKICEICGESYLFLEKPLNPERDICPYCEQKLLKNEVFEVIS